jgi:hypothetical protein
MQALPEVGHRMNVAIQELVVNPKGKEVTRRSAVCPAHNQKSSNYIGPTAQGWMFECKENSGHMRHYFSAKPPKDAPSNVDEVQRWMNEQRQARISNGGRGA